MLARFSQMAALRLGTAVVVAAMLAVGLGAASGAHARERPAEILVDHATGAILSRSLSRERRHPASLTKMMTLYLVFDALEDGRLRWDQRLPVSAHAASMPPSELGLRRGDRITVEDAVLGAAVKSANDAAVVLAEAVSGSESAFARRMTQTARALGMTRTTFRNASGLTRRGHLSTAEDMAILTRALLRDHPRRAQVFSRRSVVVRGRRYHNTNRLLGRVRGMDGMKTGWTRRAGHNLAATATRGGRQVVVVVLNARGRTDRSRRIRRLIARGFEPSVVAQAASRPVIAQRRAPGREGRLASVPPPSPRPDVFERVAARVQTRTPPPPEPSAAEAAIGVRPDGWAVQLGAFRDVAGADAVLSALLGDADAAPDRALPEISVAESGARRLHRARLVGLEEADARALCRRLRRADKACALVPPQGWAGS